MIEPRLGGACWSGLIEWVLVFTSPFYFVYMEDGPATMEGLQNGFCGTDG